MKIGVRAHDYGILEGEALPRTIKSAGFDAVQLALTKSFADIRTFRDVTENHLEQIKEDFVRYNVEINVLGCYVELSLPDKAQRLEQVENFKLGLSHAARLGVKTAGTETTGFDPARSGEEREKAYQALKDSVLRIAEKAEKEGVNIGIETVAVHTLNSAELTCRLLDEVGSNKLKVIFDPVNLMLPDDEDKQEKLFKEFFELVGKEITAVHVKDIVFENNEKIWRNIGEGILRYDLIMPWLAANKPDICLLREEVYPDSAHKDIKAMKNLCLLQGQSTYKE